MSSARLTSAVCAALLGAAWACGREAALGAPPVDDAGAPTLEVIALANEGFLLRAGDDAVLIDAFVSQRYAGYDALEGEVLRALVAADIPFDSVDLALTSHAHGDHFQPNPARAFLASSPGTILATAPQVLDTIDVGLAEGEEPAPAERLHRFLPAPGEELRYELGAIAVDVLRLSHGDFDPPIDNLGHLIELGGVRALHVGDAIPSEAEYAPYRLAERGVDVVFVPYWYFLDDAGRDLVARHFPGARLIACHVPESERAALVRRLARTDPEVIVPLAALESWPIADRG